MFYLPSFSRAISLTEAVKFSWTITLLTLICLLVHNASLDPSVKQPPGWLPGLPPVVEAKHDGEGAGGQQLLVVPVLLVLVIQAVSCCQCESISNLGIKKKEVGKELIWINIHLK